MTASRVSGMTEAFDELPTEPLLTHAEVLELQYTIEAGLLAENAGIGRRFR